MTYLPRLAALIFNQCHYITPQAADAILAALEGRIGDMGMSRFAGEPAFNDRGWAGFSVTKRGAAVVPIIGELVNRGAYLGASSGLVSYEGVRQQIRNAAADPRVKGIVLDIDSPGGMVSGCGETADLVREVSHQKPVIAVANSMMCSAAYAIASGANKIVATPSSHVGSIGVLYVHADQSRALEKRGVAVTIVQAGKHKTDGHPFGPLSAEVQADIQKSVDAHYDAFVKLVAAGRPQLSERQIRDTEARVYMGREAVAHGLADEAGTFDHAVIQAESGKVQPRSQVRSSVPASPQKIAARGTNTMETNSGAPRTDSGWESMSLAQLNDAVGTLRATLGMKDEAEPAKQADKAAPTPAAAQPQPPAPPAAETVEQAAVRGRAEEKARVKGILALPEAKERPLAALALAVETDIPVANASAVLAKVPAEGAAGTSRTSALYAAIANNGGNPKVKHAASEAGAKAASGLGASMDKMLAKSASAHRKPGMIPPAA